MSAADDPSIASHAVTNSPGQPPEQSREQLPEQPADTSSDTREEGFARHVAWLSWMGELLSGTRVLALVRVVPQGSTRVIAQSPASAALPSSAAALAQRAASHCSRQRLLIPETDEVLLALPVQTSHGSDSGPASGDKGASLVLLLFTGTLSRQQQGSLLGLASWALKSAHWLNDATPSVPGSLLGNSDALSEPMNVTQLINQLGSAYPAAVCVLHWMKRRAHHRQSRVMAVSGQTNVDRTAAVVRQMAAFVDETYADGKPKPVFREWSEPRDQSGRQGTDKTATGAGSWQACFMVPVSAGGELLVVSLHWNASPSLSSAARRQLASTLVPAVQSAWLQQERSASVWKLLWRRTAAWLRIYWQGGTKRRLQGGLLVLVLGLLLFPVEKRISAEVFVEADERHALIAPVDGYVKSAQARAGDRVSKGDLLASLDNDDLLRQAEKWTAEEQKNQQDYLSALALHDRVELSSLRESRVLIQTELEQVKAQLARHELRAPVNGIVLSDTVEDALGSAVKAGKILFEVGSAEHHRLALQVPERSISSIRTGQLLTLRMAADPKQRRQARVDTLIPMATASQGENTFKVYASPLEADNLLRPGMKGIGKILVGREPRLLQWWGSLWDRWIWLAWKLGLVA